MYMYMYMSWNILLRRLECWVQVTIGRGSFSDIYMYVKQTNKEAETRGEKLCHHTSMFIG